MDGYDGCGWIKMIMMATNGYGWIWIGTKDMDGYGCVWTWVGMDVCDGYDGYDRCGWTWMDAYWYVGI